MIANSSMFSGDSNLVLNMIETKEDKELVKKYIKQQTENLKQRLKSCENILIKLDE